MQAFKLKLPPIPKSPKNTTSIGGFDLNAPDPFNITTPIPGTATGPTDFPDPAVWLPSLAYTVNEADYFDGATKEPTSNPSPSFVEKNDCHGVSGDHWVRSRDLAAQNANDFCKQSSGSVE